MGRIKDLIYNINDFLTAILIAIVGVAVFMWRFDIVMDYPSYAAKQQIQQIEAQQDFTDVDLTPVEVENFNTDPDYLDTSSASSEAAQPAAEQSAAQASGNTETGGQQTGASTSSASAGTEDGFTVKEETKVVIPAGSSGDKIAGILLQQGLIPSKSEFIKTLVAKKADTKLKAGTFKIPAGATVSDIVEILIK